MVAYDIGGQHGAVSAEDFVCPLALQRHQIAAFANAAHYRIQRDGGWALGWPIVRGNDSGQLVEIETIDIDLNIEPLETQSGRQT